MILTEEIEEEEIAIGDITEKELSIPAESFAFIFDLVSTKFYSDPIGSIVREITSNCFDAQVESASDKPVMINIHYDYDLQQNYIEFCDNGLGLSPERIDKIFMNLFTSTKRDTNAFIGGFGIGSKSPFSYTNYFNITTVTGGFKYEYVFEKKVKSSPITLLNKSESDEPTGTKIRINIKSEYDTINFISACNSQLCYFDNVYINSSKHTSSIKNEYQIYEGDTFKYKNVNQYSNSLHLVIESVAYPIDTRQIVGSNINIPFALKFAIGELDVTPNREQVQYSDKTKNAINTRLAAFKLEIKQIFKKQTSLVIDTIEEYHKRVNSNTFIKFGETVIDVKELVGDFQYKLKGFEKLKLPKNLFFGYSWRELANSRIRKQEHSLSYDKQLAWFYFTYELDKFNNLYHESGKILMKSTDDRKYYAMKLGLTIGRKGRNVWIQRNGQRVRRQVFIHPLKTKLLHQIQTKYIAKFRSRIHKHIVSQTRVYDQVTPEWIQEYKEANRVRRVVDKTIINCKNITASGSNSMYLSNTYSVKVNDLAKMSVVFYCHKAIDIREGILKFVSEWNGFNSKKGTQRIKIIEINKTNFDKIKTIKLVHINDYFTVPELNNYIQKQRILNYISDSVNLYADYNLSNYYDNICKELRNLLGKRQNLPVSAKFVQVDVVKNYDVLYKLAEWLVYKEAIKPMNYLSGIAPESFVVQFVKQFIKTTKLNENYHSKTDWSKHDSCY